MSTTQKKGIETFKATVSRYLKEKKAFANTSLSGSYHEENGSYHSDPLTSDPAIHLY